MILDEQLLLSKYLLGFTCSGESSKNTEKPSMIPFHFISSVSSSSSPSTHSPVSAFPQIELNVLIILGLRKCLGNIVSWPISTGTNPPVQSSCKCFQFNPFKSFALVIPRVTEGRGGGTRNSRRLRSESMTEPPSD